MSSFALLDDSQANSTHPTSRLYTDLLQELVCDDANNFASVIREMHVALQQGHYGVAVLNYELGVALQGLDRGAARSHQPSRILIYKNCQRLSRAQVDDWLHNQINDSIAGIADLHANVDEHEFAQAIERIQQTIAAGDTYQVNYTFRFHFQTYGEPIALYQRLRERQSVPYGALICLPDGSVVLSLSPELFIRHQQGELLARPMKGTAAASNTDDAALNEKLNRERSLALASDEKNRAENVMIVDLLRNDLGRVAQLGSVQVPHLFDVQRFNAVLQMTSTVSARLRKDISLSELLVAIYPCGSITGAPKIRTMEIIAETETEPRGIYTGAIGWFDPVREAIIPDFCLSVPIRTLHLDAALENGQRAGVMGVGAGIVYDSVPADEYQESLLKARFLTGLPAQFALFETMFATRENGCRHLDRHLLRLTKSAAYFGMPLRLAEIKMRLNVVCSELPANTPHRLKLSLDGNGQVTLQTATLSALVQPVGVIVANTAQQSQSIWLQHKTTLRSEYDRAWQTAEQHGAFDMLFCNERGEVTEGGRSNFLYKLDGNWHTPPLSAGVLPGVMRSVLLDDPAWALTERAIQIDQLKEVHEIALCNALRGVMHATLIR